MKYFINGLKKWSSKGRVSRKEFWMFYLFWTLFFYLAIFLDYKLRLDLDSLFGYETYSTRWGILSMLYLFLSMIPAYTIQVKRMHDIGKSGYTVFFHCIPWIGQLYVLILFCRKTQMFENKYGPIPNEIIKNRNSHKAYENLSNNENLEKEAKAEIKFCRYCGHQLEKDSDFCSNCGKALK